MKKDDEVWYCVNSKGHKIPPYGDKVYPVAKPKKWTFDYVLNRIGIIIGLSMLLAVIMALSSCGTFKMTEKEKKVNYELDKLYLDYSYKRDSIIIEYNK
tara:strand:- start:1181 stop:1477 length:297 start_codon:yes stop_codon:yes gene_type:complete